MNRFIIRFLGFFSIFIIINITQLSAAELNVAHIDEDWGNGKGSVPNKGICQYRGGDGMSPAFKISNIPNLTAKIELHFTDEDYDTEGFHGIIGVPLTKNQSEIIISSFKGETNSLPDKYEIIRKHGCYNCGTGVYLGPCSGGRGHRYNVYIYAKDSAGNTLSKGKLRLGNY